MHQKLTSVFEQVDLVALRELPESRHQLRELNDGVDGVGERFRGVHPGFGLVLEV